MRRFAFSSTGNPIRSVGTVVVQKERSFVWWLTSPAESLFVRRPVPAACPLSNRLPVRLLPLPLGEPYPAAAVPIAPGFGSISEDRPFRIHSRSAELDEARCGPGRRQQPLFVTAAAQRPPILSLDRDPGARHQGASESRRSGIRTQRSGGRGGPGIDESWETGFCAFSQYSLKRVQFEKARGIQPCRPKNA
jgi:hypothetical protein